MSCSGCGTTPNLLNKFVKYTSSAPKPGPFDGVKLEHRAFTGPVNTSNLPEHLKANNKASVQMNGNGMFTKFTRHK